MAVLTFVVYAWTTSAAIGWLDSPEFVATAATLGVAHSPGHPLPSFFGRIVGLLPVGDLTFRANLSSALAGVFAALACYWAIKEALQTAAPRLTARYQNAIATLFVVMLVFSGPVWNQSVRAEVYAMQTALLAAAAACVLRFERATDIRYLYLAGLTTGLALANHHFLALGFFLPAAVFVFARRPRPTLKQSLATALFGLLGLAAFLYLPVRSATHPLVNWGAPHTLSRLLWTISGKAFQKSAVDEHVSPYIEDLAQIVYAFGVELTALGCILAMLALYVCIRTNRFRAPAVWLACSAVLVMMARALLGFDPDTPDHHSYLTFGLFAVVVLSACGVAVILEHLLDRAEPRRAVARTGFVLAAVLAFLQLGRNLPTSDASRKRNSEVVADWEIARLPPRSLVLLSYNQTSFRVQALSAVDNARPDVTFLDRSFLTYPGHAEEAKLHHPELAALIDAPLAAGHPTPIELLRGIARTRPVWIQLHPNLDKAVFPYLVPVGAFAKFFADPPTPEKRDRWEQSDRAARTRLAERIGPINVEVGTNYEENSSAETLLWLDSVTGAFYCDIGRYQAGREKIFQAQAAFKEDLMLKDLFITCRP